MVVAVPRLVIAAPSSGTGKTTVATGLMAALRRAGSTVAPFKVGPDYIDPGYHALATGRPGRNLDPVLVGPERVAPMFLHGSHGADLAVIEGVMGLFDGRIGTQGFGSTAHVAALLDAPVVLVVDTTGQSRSLAALLHGFRAYDPEVRIAGVILNRVGSPTHEEVLADACAEAGLEVLGSLRRGIEFTLPSRHLGLITAQEHGSAAVEVVDALAASMPAALRLDALVRLARAAPPISATAWDPAAEVGPERPVSRPVIAVAGGPAFSFSYAEHSELLTAAGAEVAVFDPLRDEQLPAGAGGLVLPGGFPEQHATELSANTALRTAVRDFAAAGRPVHAECGGLLYLSAELDGIPMCGVLEAAATMSPRLTLGYREAVAVTESVLLPAGTRRTAHEFHRTVIEPRGGAHPAWAWRDREGTALAEGFVHAGVHASYLHTHPAGAPESVRRFVDRSAD